ncbi:MAG: fumarate reductase/succinate dehydrogenase flavoprotein subunit, partial [Alistipes sp.]|nr:fumarate reductase/succinate dehydrogenase flavoprotein subunit [Alistipes sp.]
RLFYDTIKGGDYRAREANVYRLAEVANDIIDQCVGQGVPFAREYGGLLDNRSFGGAQVSRTFYARGQTGQQLLLGAYASLNRQIAKGTVKSYNRHEMLDLVMIDGKARGIVARNLITGEIERFGAHAVVIASGGYGNVFFLSTNAMNSNGSAAWQCYKKGAFFANPCFTQIHPTCIPVHGTQQSKLTLMSESLRNDGRIWVPKKLEDVKALRAGTLKPSDIKEEDRDYYLERRYPAFGNLVPRDVASRAAKERCDAGFGVNETGLAVFLDFKTAIERLGKDIIKQRYGNLFDMYEEITDVSPYEEPMQIFPAVHYTMGGIWVDYNLMTTIPGLYAIGEANFSDHGANRLGASALMQGLADGYFVLPYTIGDYLSKKIQAPKVDVNTPAFEEAEKAVKEKIQKLMSINGSQSVDDIHKKLGHIMWENVGMARTKESLERAIKEIQALRKEFWKDVKVVGTADSFNVELEKALRLADFLELGELMARDALNREESCGGHFRSEHQTEEGEALRHDDKFAYAAVWEYKGMDEEPELTKEMLDYEFTHRAQRNYKD